MKPSVSRTSSNSSNVNALAGREGRLPRSYGRQKEMLTQASSMHIQHMQKALQQMNLLLHNVVSDITGVSGMKIIKAILAGERDPNVLALNRQEGCRNSKETIAKSLVGNFRDEHMFALKQAVELYETYQTMIAECEQALIKHLGTQPDVTDDQPPESGKHVRLRERMRADVDVREKLFKMTGVDLFAIPAHSIPNRRQTSYHRNSA